MENKIDLGLKKGQVVLFDHSSMWEVYANETIHELKNIFGDIAIDIQHTGSTAIKFIKAKPIIDIVVGIDKLDSITTVIDSLVQNNYFHRPFMAEDLLFVKENKEDGIRTHHIHVVKHMSEEWNNQICFRDYLNSNALEALNYENLKIELQQSNSNNRNNYTAKKGDYIKEVIKKAQIDHS